MTCRAPFVHHFQSFVRWSSSCPFSSACRRASSSACFLTCFGGVVGLCESWEAKIVSYLLHAKKSEPRHYTLVYAFSAMIAFSIPLQNSISFNFKVFIDVWLVGNNLFCLMHFACAKGVGGNYVFDPLWLSSCLIVCPSQIVYVV